MHFHKYVELIECTYYFIRSFYNIAPRIKRLGICQFRLQIFSFTYIFFCTSLEFMWHKYLIYSHFTYTYEHHVYVYGQLHFSLYEFSNSYPSPRDIPFIMPKFFKIKFFYKLTCVLWSTFQQENNVIIFVELS